MSAPRSALSGRLALVLATIALIVTGFGGTMSAAWASAAGTVNTNGTALNVRSTPHLSGTVVGSLADGASISIDCDTYVYTGSDTLVAPLCGGTPTQSCSGAGLGNPRTCGEAVTWAKNHVTTTYHSDYAGRCDHVMALAYGWSASGSTSARSHWLAIPGAYKHAGDSNVPAGGLAFFSGGSS